jgi:hypothetical protein
LCFNFRIKDHGSGVTYGVFDSGQVVTELHICLWRQTRADGGVTYVFTPRAANIM